MINVNAYGGIWLHILLKSVLKMTGSFGSIILRNSERKTPCLYRLSISWWQLLTGFSLNGLSRVRPSSRICRQEIDQGDWHWAYNQQGSLGGSSHFWHVVAVCQRSPFYAEESKSSRWKWLLVSVWVKVTWRSRPTNTPSICFRKHIGIRNAPDNFSNPWFDIDRPKAYILPTRPKWR